MALRPEVVDLVGLQLIEQPAQRHRVGEIGVMVEQAYALLVRIAIKVINARRVEARRTPDNAVDLVALSEQELSEVGAVLARDAGDQRFLRRIGPDGPETSA